MPTLTLHDDLTLPVSRATAWGALHDLALLSEVVRDAQGPAAELLAGAAPRSYRLLLPTFEGDVLLLDVDAPSRLRLSFQGNGPQTGVITGQAQCRLELMGDQRTLLHWSLVIQTERQPSGFKLSGIGALKSALRALEAAVRRHHGAHLPVVAPKVPKSLFQRLIDWYLGWFAAMFNGTLYPVPKPRPRKGVPPRQTPGADARPEAPPSPSP